MTTSTEQLIDILQDDSKRAELISTLQGATTDVAAPMAEPSLMDQASAYADAVVANLTNPDFLMTGGVKTVAVLVGFVALHWGVKKLHGLMQRKQETWSGGGQVAQTMAKYNTALHRGLVYVLYLMTALTLLEAWGFHVYGMFESESFMYLLGKAASIGVIIGGCVVVAEVVHAIADRALLKGGRKATMRRNTLLPLFKKITKAVLVILGTLIVLSELGIDIGPLLAGAGVLGLAIGFGAQKLVQDFITGMFIVLEDTVRVGDVVQVASISGAVEKITVRTLILRDPRGQQHTIPWSNVGEVTNMTKDYSMAYVEAGVGYREDSKEVHKVLEQVVAHFQKDKEFGPTIQEVNFDGITTLGDSAVVHRVRLKVDPGTQWGLERAFNAKIKEMFDAKNIEIPYPHQTIYFGEDKSGKVTTAEILVKDESSKGKKKAA